MSPELKAIVQTIVLFIVRWVMKVGAGAIGAIGVSTGAIEEVLIGLLMFAVGALISLFQRKKDLATVPPEVE